EGQLAKSKPKESAEQPGLTARATELQAAQADVLQQVKRLTESLTAETRRREGAEQQAGETDRQRKELESQLAEAKQVQADLRQDLERALKQLLAQQKSSGAEHAKLEARIKELETAQDVVEKKVAYLTNSLTEEIKRREGAEQQVGALGKS